MKRGVWHELARHLDSEGVSVREIAERIGVTDSAVRKALNPELYRAIGRRDNARRAAQKRAWEREHDRPACLQCGAARGVGAHRHPQNTGLCRSCSGAARASRIAERDRQIEAWWAEGLPLREIAARMGWSRDRIGVEMIRARRRGADLPHRYSPERVANIRAGIDRRFGRAA